jgi:uncharacterized membrane protein
MAGALLVCWGLAGSLLAIAVVIPHFNPADQYPYWPDGGVIGPGGHLSAGGLLDQIGHGHGQKLATVFMLLLPVAFLALRSPLAALAVPSLALRFISTDSSFWGTAFHYNATLMPVAFLAAIDGMARIQAHAARREGRNGCAATRAWWPPGPRVEVARYGAAAMLAVAVWLAFRFPLSGLWNPQTYLISAHARAEGVAMALVPPGTTAETTLTMLAPLAARDTVYWIGTAGNPAPAYLLFDTTSSGYSTPPASIPAFVRQSHPGVRYQMVFQASGVYVFRRASGSADTRG